MKILGIDSSGLVAATALMSDGIVTAEYQIHNKKTHSQTLMPMISEMMSMADVKPEELDAIAVSEGPGSFTGLRIGASIAKGLAWTLKIPIVPVSSLMGLAANVEMPGQIVCPIMDARRNQVYTGVYCYTDHRLDTVWEQDTMSIEALAEGLNCLDHEVIFLGDGVAVYREKLQELLTIPFSFAPAHVNRQRAAAVGALAEVYYKEGKIQTAEEHEPEYLRKSQAERERAERESVKHADVVKKQENGEKSE